MSTNVNHVLTVLELLQSKSRNLDDFLRARRRFVYRQFATPFGPQIWPHPHLKVQANYETGLISLNSPLKIEEKMFHQLLWTINFVRSCEILKSGKKWRKPLFNLHSSRYCGYLNSYPKTRNSGTPRSITPLSGYY